ncbi:hypothetical protein [Nocardia pseudovaccinii]|uniref:hypothetical protein n=1 Tax=Nocardia pseudovaccinii TaxID=189540 RepID=UPI0007A4366E|nr:hypothetical protein [Nocardia pseudovaccinii]
MDVGEASDESDSSVVDQQIHIVESSAGGHGELVHLIGIRHVHPRGDDRTPDAPNGVSGIWPGPPR